MKKIFSFLLLTLIFFSGIFIFKVFRENIYSKDILKLEILAPKEVDFGQEIEYTISFKNNGKIRLEEPELVFEYPEGSLPEEKKSLRLRLKSEDLGGDIYPGQEKIIILKGRIFGKEGERKIAKASLSFRPKNLQARYETNTSFISIIKSVPISFDLDIPSKIEANKEFIFYINYFSNLNYPLSNLRIKIDYPPDFEFIEAKPKGLEKNEWEIDFLNKAEGGRIEILGKLSGQPAEQKNFKINLFLWQKEDLIFLKENQKVVEIVKPSLYITQQINNHPQYIASPGDFLHYQIFFRNIGQTPLTNLLLVVRLEGKAFDFQSLKVISGHYKPGDNSILWDGKNLPKLQFLDSQEEGEVEFWIKLKDSWEVSGPQDENPVLKTKVYLSQAAEEFITKVNSKIELSQKGYFADEIFGNLGSLPPRIGQTTTYTIIWQVKNYFNKLKNGKVKAILPQEVRLTGKIFPEDEVEKFTFDSLSREIVWKLEDLDFGLGILNPAKILAFQIAFTPSPEQKGQIPNLISEAKIIAEDTWTESTLENTSPAIKTNLPDDQTITEEMGVVQ